MCMKSVTEELQNNIRDVTTQDKTKCQIEFQTLGPE